MPGPGIYVPDGKGSYKRKPGSRKGKSTQTVTGGWASPTSSSVTATTSGPAAPGGTSAGPSYQPPSAIERLRAYRKGQKADSSPEEAAERREKRKAEELSAASSIVAADLGFEAVPDDGPLKKALRRAGKKDRREARAEKRETTRKINREFKELAPQLAPTTLKGGARNRQEALANRFAIKNLTQKDRDLLVGGASREDWKVARKEGLGVTRAVRDPWIGKKTPTQERRTIRSLVAGEDETGVSPFPTEQQVEADKADQLAELAGLDLSPVDMATLAPFAWPGRGIKLGKAVSRAVKAGEKATDASVLTSRAAGTSALKATKTGKRVKRLNQFMQKPVRPGGKVTRRQAVRRTQFGATAGAVTAGTVTGHVPAALEGGYKAVVDDPMKVIGTTSRNLISMFTAPLTIAANVGLTAKRLPRAALGEEGMTYDKAVSPTRQVGEQMLEEAKHAIDVWTSKDPDRIGREVQDTYGLLPYMTAGALLRPGFRGSGKKIADATINKIPVPRKDATVGQLRDRRRGRWETSVQEGRAEGDKQSQIREYTDDAVAARQMLNRPQFSKINRRLEKFNKRRADTGGQPVDLGDLATTAETMGLPRKLDRQQIEDILQGSDVDAKDRPMLEALLRTPEVHNPDTPAGRLFDQMRDAFQKATPYMTEDLMGDQLNALKIEALATADRISRGEVARGERGEALAMPDRPEKQLDDAWEARIVGNQEAKAQLKKRNRKARKKERQIEADEKKLAALEGARASVADLSMKVLDGEVKLKDLTDRKRELTTLLKGDGKRAPRPARREGDTLPGVTADQRTSGEIARRGREYVEEQMGGSLQRLDIPETEAYRKVAGELGIKGANNTVLATLIGREVIAREIRAIEKAQRDHRQAKDDLRQAERDAEDWAALPEPQRKARRTRLETRKRKAEAERQAIMDRAEQLVEESRSLRGTTTKEQRQAIINQIREESAERRADIDGITPAQARERRKQLKDDMDRVTADIAGYSNLISEPRVSRADQDALEDSERMMDDLRRERDELRALTVEEINPDLLRERVAAKRRENLAREQESTREAIQSEFDAVVDERMELYNLAMPSYIRHQEIENPRMPESKRTTRGNQGYSVARTYQRTGKEAQKGGVDRSFKAFFRAVEGKAMRDKNRHLSGYVARNHMFEWENPSTGLTQRYLTDTEFDRLPLAEQQRLERDFYKMDQRLFTDPGKEGFQQLLGNGKFTPNKMEELNRRIESTAVEKRMGKGEGTRYAYVEKGPVDRIIQQENDLHFAERVLTELGLLSSRLTLGTSVGWAAAQPIAEMLTLMAAYPNPIKVIKGFAARQRLMASDPEAARNLRMLAGNTLGTDPATAAALGRNSAASRVMREFGRSPEGELARQIAHLEVLGKIDRWKGAAIREVGVLMEIDKNLKQSVRSSKAVTGMDDQIENIADDLAAIPTDAGRVKYLFSKEGIRAGEQVMKNIDDALGNWTTVGSKGERAAAGLMFFYPFIRFSMKWVFQTYPRDHPVRYALLNTLGTFNAEMIEDIIGDDPTFLSDWAMVPVFGEEGRITNLIPVNRLMGTGNSVLEQVGKAQNPLAFLNVVNPLAVGIPIRNLMGRDQFGEPVEDPFSDDSFTFGDTLRGMVDQSTDLAWPLREIKRHYNINYDAGKLSINTSGRQGRPGDNPDDVEEFIRRMGGPLAEIYSLISPGSQVGIPAEVLRDKHMVDRMWGQYTTGRSAQSGSWSEEATTAKDKDAAWQKKLFYKTGSVKQGSRDVRPKWLRSLEDSVGIWNTKYAEGVRKWEGQRAEWKKWRETSAGYEQYQREQGEKDEGKMMADVAAYTLKKLYQASGDEMPSSKAINDGIKRANELLHGVKPEPEKVKVDPDTGKPILDPARDIIPAGGDPVRIPKGARAWRHAGSIKDLPVDANPVDLETAVVARAADANPLRTSIPASIPATRKQQIKQAKRTLKAKAKFEASKSGKVTGLPSGKEFLAPIYSKMAKKHGLGPKGASILAAINEVETSFGDNLSTSSAGAMGWMQFMPGTWDAYGKGDPNDPNDAIDAAANYLKASGAPNDWDKAIFAYNHADWYVRMVKEGAQKYPAGEGNQGGDPKLKNQWLRQVERSNAMGVYEIPEAPSKDAAAKTMWRQPRKSRNGKMMANPDMGANMDIDGEVVRLGHTIAKWVGGEILINSGNRPGDDGDHGAASALDIHALAARYGDAETEKRGDQIARAAVFAVGGTKEQADYVVQDTPGDTVTVESPNGARVQIIWKSNVGGDHYNHVHVGVLRDSATEAPFRDMSQPMSPMQEAKAQQQMARLLKGDTGGVQSGGGSPSGGGGGSGSTGGSGAAGGGGATPWENLQAFRIGTNPNQKVPLWGGGTNNEGTSSPTDFPSAVFGIAQTTKPELPKFQSTVESEADPMVGLPTFEVPRKRRKVSSL